MLITLITKIWFQTSVRSNREHYNIQSKRNRRHEFPKPRRENAKHFLIIGGLIYHLWTSINLIMITFLSANSLVTRRLKWFVNDLGIYDYVHTYIHITMDAFRRFKIRIHIYKHNFVYCLEYRIMSIDRRSICSGFSFLTGGVKEYIEIKLQIDNYSSLLLMP